MHNFIVDVLTLVYKPVQYWKKDLMLFDEDKTALLQAKWLLVLRTVSKCERIRLQPTSLAVHSFREGSA